MKATEAVLRSSYGRLVSILTARTRDIAAAEDALSGAFVAAMDTWPEKGIPDAPEAWLLTAARRLLNASSRHQEVRARTEREIEMIYHELQQDESKAFPDDRLKLLFVCAHPSIDPNIRTPLMLQSVLGLDAERIGAAFLVPGKTMGQRLSRAKAKIKDAGIRFSEPEQPDLPDRLTDVLNAIYAAYGTGWDMIDTPEAKQADLSEEAVFLAKLVVDLLPKEPEPKGLLSLMLFLEARRPARRGKGGEFIALEDQNSDLWEKAKISDAESLLVDASKFAVPGRFQIEAAIQSYHVASAFSGHTSGTILIAFYDLLTQLTASIGAYISKASVVAKYGSPEDGLALLDQLDPAKVHAHQPYWATRAAILAQLNRGHDAREAFDKAIELTEQDSVAEFLRKRKAELSRISN